MWTVQTNNRENKTKDLYRPAQYIPNQDTDYPIYFFQTQKPYPSKEGTTYYSSDRSLLITKLNNILDTFFKQYKDKGGYQANQSSPNTAPTSWTFYNSKRPILSVGIIVTTVYEAQERSETFISNIMEKEGFNIYQIKGMRK
jgi:CCR4-NOT transcriptional regulation complex NOT5 subunit